MGKVRGKEEYICGIYTTILNYGYINDRIISDWTRYRSPIEMTEDRHQIGGNAFDIGIRI